MYVRAVLSRAALAGAVLSGAVLSVACTPVYAPPVRSVHGGGPRRSFDAPMVDVGDAAIIVPGVQGRLPLTRYLAAELGGDLGMGSWQMGHIATRLTAPIGADGPGQLAAADLELGAGFGRGGEYVEQGGGAVSDGAAYGAFIGAGFGTYARDFGGYVRVRAQGTRSRHPAIPDTLWGSAVLGMQFGSRAPFRLAAGVGAYHNRLQEEAFPVVEPGFEIGSPRTEGQDEDEEEEDADDLPARFRD